jgi:uncharacterized membrane protein
LENKGRKEISKLMKRYLILTLVISILVGIILPLALGVRDPTLIAICFSSVWFLYAVLVLITTFLIKPGLRIKFGMQSRIYQKAGI